MTLAMEDEGSLNAASQLMKSTLAAAPAVPLSSGHHQQHLVMAAMQPADCSMTAGSCKSTSNYSSSNSSTTTSTSSSCRGSSSSAKAGAAHATGVPPWALLRTLLFGFDQPALEHSFLTYKYQQTRAYDKCAAAYHGLIAAAHVFNFPRSSWLHTRTQLGMLGFICGHAMVPLLVLSCRRALGPRGREAGALLVDVAAALQAVGVRLGWLCVPTMSTSRLEQGSGWMDDVLMIAGIAIMRAFLGQARMKLFAASFLVYMLAAAAVSVAFGMHSTQVALRFTRAYIVAVAIAGVLELSSRRAFLRLLVCSGNASSSKGSGHGSIISHAPSPPKVQQHDVEREQQQQQPPKSQPPKLQPPQQQQQQQQQSQQQQQQQRNGQLLADMQAMTRTGRAATATPVDHDAIMAQLAELMGPGFCEKLAAGTPQQHLVGMRKPKPYRAHGSRYHVGVKVRTNHVPGSPSFDQISQALISAVNEAALGCVAARVDANDAPRVHAACVQGCVQLLAAISMDGGVQGGHYGDAELAAWDLQAALERLVRGKLRSLYVNAPLPEFDVAVAPDDGSFLSDAAIQATATESTTFGRLVSCSPPCLAAGGGSTEVQLLVHIVAHAAAENEGVSTDGAAANLSRDVSNAGAASDQSKGVGSDGAARGLHEGDNSGGGAAGIVAKLVLWGAGVDKPLVVQCITSVGLHMIRLSLPAPEQPGVLHLALLLGDHSLAFVQPLLVLPSSAAAELRQLWVASMLQSASVLAPANCEAKQPEQQQEMCSGVTATMGECWGRVLGPLVADIAYVLGYSAPALAPASAHECQPHAALELHQRPPGVQALDPSVACAVVNQASGAQAVAEQQQQEQQPLAPPEPTGVAPATAHQPLTMHLLRYLKDAQLWALLDHVCGVLRALRGDTGRPSSSELEPHSLHRQQHQQLPPAKLQEHAALDGSSGRASCSSGSSAPQGSRRVSRQVAAMPVASSSRASASCANARTGAAAEGQHAGASQPSSLQALLFGFRQQSLEQAFLRYKFQQTVVIDTACAMYHGAMTLALISNYPPSSWGHPIVLLSMLGWVCCWGLPAALLLRFREWLGPRGREVGALLVDVVLGLQALCFKAGLMIVPDTVKARCLDTSGFKDDIITIVSMGVLRACLSQARCRLFALAFSAYAACSGYAVLDHGLPVQRTIVRYILVAAVGILLCAALELRSRRAFLRLVKAKQKAGSSTLQASHHDEHVATKAA